VTCFFIAARQKFEKLFKKVIDKWLRVW